MQNVFHGLGIALITPFKDDGSVDYDALVNLVKYQLDNGADFFCILATTGEAPCLTREEKDTGHKEGRQWACTNLEILRGEQYCSCC